jgi:uncharacterized membrane protein
MTTRAAEKTFGVLAIAGGVAIVVATLAGARPGPLILVLAAVAVVAWLVYFYGYRRRRA